MANNLASHLDDTSIVQRKGTVALKHQRGFEVRSGDSSYQARRAVSCLVEPEVGDVVLLALSERDCFVLAVLEREEGAGATLSHAGDVTWQTDGDFAIRTGKTVDVQAGERLNLTSGRLTLRGALTEVLTGKLAVVGSKAEAQIKNMTVVGDTLDTVAERVSQKVKRAYRWITEIDEKRANTINHTAKGLCRVHSENTVLTSDHLVKMDGEQIHMG